MDEKRFIEILSENNNMLLKNIENTINKKFEDNNKMMFEYIDKRFEDFEVKVDKKFEDFEAKVDKKFEDFEAKVDKKFEAFEIKINKRFENMDKKFDTIIKSHEFRISSLESKVVSM